MLGWIGTDLALSQLCDISQRAKFKAIKVRAREEIEAIAVERDLGAEQLADRLVPGLELDDNGQLTLDYGSRQFTVSLDEQLKPQVSDSAGNRLKTLPRPGAGDGEEAAPSYQRFTALKKDLRGGPRAAGTAGAGHSPPARLDVDRVPDAVRGPPLGRAAGPPPAVARRRHPVPAGRESPAR